MSQELATTIDDGFKKTSDALNALTTTRNKIDEIVKWISYTYQKGDKEQCYAKAEEFTTAVFTNVVHYINSASKEMINVLDLQLKEVDKLSTEVNIVSSRFKSARSITGKNELHKMNTAKTALRTKKMKRVKLPDPETVIVEEGYINWGMYDNVGVGSGTNNQQTTKKSWDTPAPVSDISLNNLPSLDIPDSTSVQPKKKEEDYSKPPTIDLPSLEIPSLNLDAPTTQRKNSLIPPPPSFDNTIPSPPSQGGNIPPPPPSNNIPPPPSNNLPPPPPPPGDLPPPPPPPAMKGTAPSKPKLGGSDGTSGRGALLESIRAGKQLKKVPRPDDRPRIPGREIQKTNVGDGSAPPPKKPMAQMSLMDQVLAKRSNMLKKSSSGGGGSNAVSPRNTPSSPRKPPQQTSSPSNSVSNPPQQQGGNLPPPPPPSGDLPPPPPPVMKGTAPKPKLGGSDGTSGRGALLESIRAGKQLRKVPRPDDRPRIPGREIQKTNVGDGSAPPPKKPMAQMSLMDQVLAQRNKLKKKT